MSSQLAADIQRSSSRSSTRSLPGMRRYATTAASFPAHYDFSARLHRSAAPAAGRSAGAVLCQESPRASPSFRPSVGEDEADATSIGCTLQSGCIEYTSPAELTAPTRRTEIVDLSRAVPVHSGNGKSAYCEGGPRLGSTASPATSSFASDSGRRTSDHHLLGIGRKFRNDAL